MIPIRIVRQTFIGCLILFLILFFNYEIRLAIRNRKQQHVPCAEYPPVDGSGRPEVCQ